MLIILRKFFIDFLPTGLFLPDRIVSVLLGGSHCLILYGQSLSCIRSKGETDLIYKRKAIWSKGKEAKVATISHTVQSIRTFNDLVQIKKKFSARAYIVNKDFSRQVP